MRTEDVLEGIRNGDRGILENLYKENYLNIEKFILSNSGSEDDASDVLQECIILLFQKIKKNELSLSSSLKSYLFAICKNMWLLRLRRQKKLATGNIQDIEDINSDEDVINDIVENERKALYRKHFLTLGNGCKEILDLFFRGKPMKEIAQQMHTTEGNVRKKKFDCQQKLIKAVRKDPMFYELKSESKVM
ncbi:MAG: sigma-70 family RNA polymerase sigma factor [Bacteroidota bacterium]